MLLLLLSRFSHVWLCATPEMAAYQALLSLGFSRQEHWSGLPFPSPMLESEKWKWGRSVVSDSLPSRGLQPTRLLCPWDFPKQEYWSGVPLPSPKVDIYFFHLTRGSQGWLVCLRHTKINILPMSVDPKSSVHPVDSSGFMETLMVERKKWGLRS